MRSMSCWEIEIVPRLRVLDEEKRGSYIHYNIKGIELRCPNHNLLEREAVIIYASISPRECGFLA